jgi:hypothetical protein
MSWAGCYSLDLYCDRKSDAHQYSEFPHQYTDEHGSACRAMARRDGWVINKDGAAVCPKCSGKKGAPGVRGTFICRKPAIGPACEKQCERCAADGVPVPCAGCTEPQWCLARGGCIVGVAVRHGETK